MIPTRRLFAALAFAVLAACASSPAPALDKDVRRIDAGLVHGATEGGSIHFRGIPYAKPPVGELRWKAPQPVARWSDTREATKFGPACMQRNAPGDRVMSEDCLTLNVSIPEAAKPGDRLPVLVRIHGGGFVSGDGAGGHSASVWNRQGIVLVTVNYRLGALGYFAHVALKDSKRETVNYGLQDLRASLQWVHANIASFGGDPKQVTITGVSAGGEAVQLLMLTPGMDGLFARAISSSGYAAWPLPLMNGDAEDFALTISTKASGRTGLNASELRAIPADKLVGAVDGFMAPVVDGVTITDQPINLFVAGKAARVPLLTGGNSYEGTVYASSGTTEQQVLDLLGKDRDKVLALYADDFAASRSQGITRLFGDMRYVLSCAQAAGSVSKRDPAWLYFVTYVPPERRPALGSSHGGETPLLERGGADGPGPKMQAYWANFIKTGDPNGAGLPPWPKANAGRSQWMIFGDTITSGDVLRVKLDAIAVAMGLPKP